MYSAWSNNSASNKTNGTDTEQAAAAKCGHCGTEAAILRCGVCKVAKYCKKDCQRKDWRDHKRVCATLKQAEIDKKIAWEEIRTCSFQDDHEKIKVYFMGLDGVGDIPKENITLEMGERKLILCIRGLGGSYESPPPPPPSKEDGVGGDSGGGGSGGVTEKAVLPNTGGGNGNQTPPGSSAAAAVTAPPPAAHVTNSGGGDRDGSSSSNDNGGSESVAATTAVVADGVTTTASTPADRGATSTGGKASASTTTITPPGVITSKKPAAAPSSSWVGGRNLRYLAPELWGSVVTSETKMRVKSDKIIVTLKKKGESMMNYSWEKFRRT